MRVPQWIIDLEAPVDVAALLRENEDLDTAIVQAHRAAQVLEDRNPSSSNQKCQYKLDRFAEEWTTQPWPLRRL